MESISKGNMDTGLYLIPFNNLALCMFSHNRVVNTNTGMIGSVVGSVCMSNRSLIILHRTEQNRTYGGQTCLWSMVTTSIKD